MAVNHEPSKEDFKNLLKIINLVESIISDEAPAIFIKPKYRAMKSLLKDLNNKFLEKNNGN